MGQDQSYENYTGPLSHPTNGTKGGDVKDGVVQPRLLPWKHKPGKTFDPKLDIDRVKVKMDPVGLQVDAKRNITAQYIDLPGVSGSKYNKQSFAVFLRNVFTPEECAKMIEWANTKGWSPALLNIGGGWQQYCPDARDNARCIIECDQTAQAIGKILEEYLPKEFNKRKLHGLNERLRFLCYYTGGQKFEAHKDAYFTRPGPHEREGDTSFVTVQCYLNEEFTGGATTFLLRDGEVPVKPETGSVLLFSQDLLHEGSAVETGTKYTVRTEAMYAPLEDGVEVDEDEYD